MIWHEVSDGVYEVSTNLGTDTWQQCLSELQSCQSTGSNHYLTEPDLGAKDLFPQGEACARIVNYFKSTEWLDHVVALCCSNQSWILNWTSPSREWFQTHTRFNYEWHLAPPRYIDHAWHVDCLKILVHGMMYVTVDNDARSTTLFKQNYQDHDLAITTGFDRGWILLQNGRQEHRGINRTLMPRYTFKWGLTLRL